MDPKILNKDYSKLEVPETFSETLTDTEQGQLRDQAVFEYKAAYDHLIPKIVVGIKRLQLYNNQRKNPQSVGDNSLFTIISTMLAQLYFDKINSKFGGIDDFGDKEIADNLNAMAKYDYSTTYKYMIDFYWIWYTLMYGASPLGMPGLDRETLSPKHILYDPLSFLRDPNAAMVNSVAGMPGAGNFGTIINLTEEDLKKPVFMNTSGLDWVGTFKDQDMSTLSSQAKQGRDLAQNRNVMSKNTSNGYDVLDWYTKFKGRLCRVNFVGKDFSRIIRFNYMRDYEGEYETKWRLVLKQLSPMSMDWDGVSVADFVEDKQRAKARLLNLTLDNIEDNQRQSYIYDRDAGIDPKALSRYAFNKYISSKGPVNNVIVPIQKAPIRSDLVNYISNTLEDIYEKASASPALQQGAQPQQERTLGENQLVTAGSENRYKLFSAINGWSEKQYYELYYYDYKNDFHEGIDEKTIRLKNVYGTITRKLRRENIISLSDPDVEIETLTESEMKKSNNRQLKVQFFQLASQLPDADIKYMIQNLGNDYEIDSQELQMMIPPNAFELQAREENIKLSKNEKVKINPDDDDDIHIKENSKATSTAATNSHIWGHQQQKILKVTRPDLFPKLQQQATLPGQTQLNGNPGNSSNTPVQVAQGGISSNPAQAMQFNSSPLNKAS